jgi:hypothetical protein
MSGMENVNYAIHVNCIEDMQYKLKTVILVLKRFMTLILEDIYAPVVIMINVISGRILILV